MPYAARALASLTALFLAALLAACATPVAPAYVIEHQQLEVTYQASPEPHLKIRGTYKMKNTGNKALASLEVSMPGTKLFALMNLRAEMDGRDITPSASVDAQGGRITLQFEPPWPHGAKREISIAYELGIKGAVAGMAGEDAVFLPSGEWYPIWSAPKSALSSGGEPPKKWDLLVHSPADYRIHASGRERGAKKKYGQVLHRFEQRKEDFRPFVLAGRFQETEIKTGDGTVVFWTRFPLTAADVQEAGAHIAATVKAYDTAFGPRGAGVRPVWVVQCGAKDSKLVSGTWADSGSRQKTCPSLPEAALLSEAWGNIGGDAALAQADLILADTWFRHWQALGHNEASLPLDALPMYTLLARIHALAPRGDLHDFIAEKLKGFESERKEIKEKPLLQIDPSEPGLLRDWGYGKSWLFLFALEDEFGREHLEHALAHMRRALRGQAWTANDLRGALEQETGKDAAAFFRKWLTETGIPEDFRRRYP
jgi:hypothetical protein